MSGEKRWLTKEEAYAPLPEQHAALTDKPIAGMKIGVLEKIESYLIDTQHVNKRELTRRTPFFSRDQREHIVEEAKANWSARKPYQIDGYRVDSYVREGNKNVSLQYSFRNLQTGRFERPKRKEEEK